MGDRYGIQVSQNSRPSIKGRTEHTSSSGKALSENNIVKTPIGKIRLSKGDVSNLVGVSGDMAKGVLSLASTIVNGQKEIATIEATSNAKIRETEAEIRKIYAEAGKEVDVIKANADKDNARIDRLTNYVDGIVRQLDAHPEWSDEVKKEIIRLGVAGMESGRS